MVNYIDIYQVLRPGETALVLFTDGTNLRKTPQGHVSESWKVDPGKQYDHVVIYCRHGTHNYVLLAERGDPQARDEHGRHCVDFKATTFLGITNSDWPEFADTQQNPVRYIDRTEDGDTQQLCGID